MAEEQIETKIKTADLPEAVIIKKPRGFQKGHKAFRKQSIPFTDFPMVNSDNSAEILVRATNKIIDIYNKIAESIEDKDIRKMDIKTKINALQKLSFLNKSTEKIKPSNMNFIKIDTTKKSAEQLEDALLKFNSEEDDE